MPLIWAWCSPGPDVGIDGSRFVVEVYLYFVVSSVVLVFKKE